MTNSASKIFLVMGLFSLAMATADDRSTNTEDKSRTSDSSRLYVEVPRGLPRLPIPADNPLTVAKVSLGRQLFFDPRFSADGKVSCASCHIPQEGWSDVNATSNGIDDRMGGRHSPTVLNAAYNRRHFWDGRAATLEQQALGPLLDPNEMGLPSLAALEAKLMGISGYRSQFEDIFGEVTAENFGKAVAAFERTLISGDAPYDRFKEGDLAAMSEPAQRGQKLFFNKAHCAACHSGPNFTDGAFHNIGVGIDAPNPDKGRQNVSNLLGDRGSFKTPGLRDVARRAPYMHDGRHQSLEAVIAYYNKGGIPNDQLDEEIYPLKLTKREQQDLLIFLTEGLTSHNYPQVVPPKLPQ